MKINYERPEVLVISLEAKTSSVGASFLQLALLR